MKSRGWRKTGIVTGFLALVLVVAGVVAPRFLDLNRYHHYIVSEVEKNTGGQVTLGHITWGFTHRLWLEVDGFTITNASAFAGDIRLTRLYASVSIPHLLAKQIAVKKLQLEGSGIKFRLGLGTQDTDVVPAEKKKYAGVQLPMDVDIEHLSVDVDRLELSNGMTLPGETQGYVFTEVKLAATNVAPEAVMTFNASLQDKAPSGLGSLNAQGTFSGLSRVLTLDHPQLNLQAVLNALSADAIRPYLKDTPIKDQLAGNVSMQVNIESDLTGLLSAQGSIDLGQLTYTNPALWDAPLAGEDTTLGFHIGLNSQSITAEKITLKRGRLSLAAQAELHDWNKQPVIRNGVFSSELPLGDLVPLVPWKLIGEDAALIRSILGGGGKLVINDLTLADISLDQMPATLFDWVSDITMAAQVDGVSIQPAPKVPAIEDIEATLQLENSILQLQGLSGRVSTGDLIAAVAPDDDRITLDIKAQLGESNSKPSVTLQHLKTSTIPLPLLAQMIPWEELDQSTQAVKAVLQSGGTLTINALSLPAIGLTRQPVDPKQLLAGATLATDLTNITVPQGFSPVTIEGISGQVTLENNVLQAEKVRARVGPVALPLLDIRATDVAEHFRISLGGKGPLQVAASGDREIEQLLMDHGLKSITGSADVEVSADFDQYKPDDWTASGSLLLHDVRARTHPADVVMDHLTGQVTFRRETTLEIRAQDISAQINQAPLHLSGKVTGIGSPGLLVNAHATTRGLDLADLAELVPALKNIKVKGTLDMDVDAHVPYAAPAGSRLRGMLSARDAGLQSPSFGFAVTKGNLDLELNGNTATIKNMGMIVNEQQIDITGRLINPVEPDIKATLTATDLNLDRLLTVDKASKHLSTTSTDRSHTEVNKSLTPGIPDKEELPTLARKLTADVQLHADRGRYSGMQFEKLDLDLLYKRGLLESFDMSATLNTGVVAAKGSADFRKPQHISFRVDPNIKALPLHAVTPLLGTDNMPLSGVLALQGQLRGSFGGNRDLFSSLAGELDASLGSGSISSVGKTGEFIAKLASMTHIRRLFSGRFFSDISSRGLPFEEITAQTTLEKGTLTLARLHFGSDVMTVDAQGKIDLMNEQLEVVALLAPLARVDDALNIVPLVGDALQDISKIRIDVGGALDKPEIRTAEVREIGTSIETEVEQPAKMLEGVDKGLKKLF